MKQALLAMMATAALSSVLIHYTGAALQDPVEVRAAELVWEAIPAQEDAPPDYYGELAQGYLAVVDCSLPEDLRPIFEAAGERYGIAPEILEAIGWKESHYIRSAENGSCKGIMQVSTTWHLGRMQALGYSDIFDPEANIFTAADYLAEIFESEPDLYEALKIYNGDHRPGISDYSRDVVATALALQAAQNK